MCKYCGNPEEAKKAQGARRLEMPYTLTITESQARIISMACEVLARLGIGQWRTAIEQMPLDIKDYGKWHNDLDDIGKILRNHTKHNVDGWNKSLGIYSPDVNDIARVAWDIHHVIRHKLAWERAVNEGIVESEESPREWSSMITVDYDEPRKSGKEDLAKIERIL